VSWQCGTSVCPASGVPACTSALAATTINGFGGCKYPPSTVCTCETLDGGAPSGCHAGNGAAGAGGGAAGADGGAGGLDAGADASSGGIDGGVACGIGARCGSDQVCVHPLCGGSAVCIPLSDGGLCPDGFVFTSSCGPGVGPGCVPTPCTPPPPSCVTIQPSCGGVPTCACLPGACSPSACVSVDDGQVTCD
jgi:hypothetical protein